MKRLFFLLAPIFLFGSNLDYAILKEVCKSEPIKSAEDKALVCPCNKVKVDVSVNEDYDSLGIGGFIKGGFSSLDKKELIVQTIGCEPHFDIDDNENLVPINYQGYIFATNSNGKWKVVYYKPIDLGLSDSKKVKLSNKEAILAKQNYDNAGEFFLTRLMLHTFNKDGKVSSKIIYRGSVGDKKIDDRIKKWEFKDLNNDGKKDIKIYTNNGKVVIFYRQKDSFVKAK